MNQDIHFHDDIVEVPYDMVELIPEQTKAAWTKRGLTIKVYIR